MNQRKALELALQFCEFLWQDVAMNEYTEEYRNRVEVALRAALAESQDEPVAKVEVMTTGGNAGLATRIVEIDDHLRERLRPGQMLYTHPAPVRQPLTDDGIAEALAGVLGLPHEIKVEITRAVEQAHGIGVQDE